MHTSPGSSDHHPTPTPTPAQKKRTTACPDKTNPKVVTPPEPDVPARLDSAPPGCGAPDELPVSHIYPTCGFSCHGNTSYPSSAVAGDMVGRAELHEDLDVHVTDGLDREGLPIPKNPAKRARTLSPAGRLEERFEGRDLASEFRRPPKRTISIRYSRERLQQWFRDQHEARVNLGCPPPPPSRQGFRSAGEVFTHEGPRPTVASALPEEVEYDSTFYAGLLAEACARGEVDAPVSCDSLGYIPPPPPPRQYSPFPTGEDYLDLPPAEPRSPDEQRARSPDGMEIDPIAPPRVVSTVQAQRDVQSWLTTSLLFSAP